MANAESVSAHLADGAEFRRDPFVVAPPGMASAKKLSHQNRPPACIRPQVPRAAWAAGRSELEGGPKHRIDE